MWGWGLCGGGGVGTMCRWGSGLINSWPTILVLQMTVRVSFGNCSGEEMAGGGGGGGGNGGIWILGRGVPK